MTSPTNYVELGRACNIRRGTTITQKDAVVGDIPVIGGGTKPSYFHNEANRGVNTITISASGANAGFVNLWRQPIFASDCSTVEVDSTKQDIFFVYYFLQSKQSYITANFRSGAAQPHVYAKDIAKLMYPILPLDKQREIVDKLDAAIYEIQRSEECTAKCAENIEALFQNYLFGEFESSGKDWKIQTLNDVCIVERGSSPRPIKRYFTDDEDGVNWIKIGDTEEGGKYVFSTKQKITKEGATQSRFVKPGDFILTNSMSYGRPYIMRTEGYIHDGWFVLRLNENIDTEFFYYLLTSPYIQNQFKKLAAGAVVKNISGDLVKKTILPIPPLKIQKELAEKFAAAEENVKNISNAYIEKIKLLSSLKAAILNKAFNSQIEFKNE